MTAKGEAGNPGAVATSNLTTEGAPGAAALGENNKSDKETEKPKLTGARRRLPPPTSLVEEMKKNKQNQKKDKPPNLNIPKEKKTKESEDDKLKQPTLKEFAMITKKKK